MSIQSKPVKHLRAKADRRGRVGAPEVLTEELARRIAKMIQDFPDAGVEVTWNNVIEQTKRRFGHKLRRNVLAHKEWGGRRLVHEAFQDAKAIQRRSIRDRAPKYAKEPRSRLRMIVAKLQAENLALRETLSRVRAEQYDEIFSLLETRTPLNRAVEQRAQANQATESAATQPPNAESDSIAVGTSRNLNDARVARAKRFAQEEADNAKRDANEDRDG